MVGCVFYRRSAELRFLWFQCPVWGTKRVGSGRGVCAEGAHGLGRGGGAGGA